MLVRNVSITSDDFAINARLDNNMYAFRESDGSGTHETYWMHVKRVCKITCFAAIKCGEGVRMSE